MSRRGSREISVKEVSERSDFNQIGPQGASHELTRGLTRGFTYTIS